MNRITKALADTTSKVLFRASEVTAVVDVAPDLRSIELSGEALRKATWQVGDKVQVRTGLDGLTLRTYTPISWDATRGSTRLLAYPHGDGPGSAWVRAASVGSPCQLFGPRRSLKLGDLAGPILFVGDETSFALVAAWHGQHPAAPPVAELFEVDDLDGSNLALGSLGVPSAQLFRREEGAAHVDRLAATSIELLHAHPDASLCLTGKAQTIAAVRRQIKAAGLSTRAASAKAYWDENRSGLD